jgi:hypothetical protein
MFLSTRISTRMDYRVRLRTVPWDDFEPREGDDTVEELERAGQCDV